MLATKKSAPLRDLGKPNVPAQPKAAVKPGESSPVPPGVGPVASGGQEMSVCVAVRVRPLRESELSAGAGMAWSIQDNAIAQLLAGDENRLASTQAMCFDQVFPPEATNSDVFHALAESVVVSAMKGINGTIFAYGQTASGKTHTMQGTEEDPGILRLAGKMLFAQPDVLREITMTYVEIYNEKVRDLLSLQQVASAEDLKVVRDPADGGFKATGVNVVRVASYDAFIDAFHKGESRRHVGSTDVNARSSRSHTLLTLQVSSKAGPTLPAVRGRLSLVDLAGSESVRLTHADGMRLKEGSNINLSLLTLSLVIKDLATKSQEGFINFRGSQLTKLLQSSLVGNCRTAVVCCATPSPQFVSETLSTLKFANHAKNIRTQVTTNVVAEEMRTLQQYKENELLLRRMLAEANDAAAALEEQLRCNDAAAQSEALAKSEADAQALRDKLASVELHAETLEREVVALREEAARAGELQQQLSEAEARQARALGDLDRSHRLELAAMVADRASHTARADAEHARAQEGEARARALEAAVRDGATAAQRQRDEHAGREAAWKRESDAAREEWAARLAAGAAELASARESLRLLDAAHQAAAGALQTRLDEAEAACTREAAEHAREREAALAHAAEADVAAAAAVERARADFALRAAAAERAFAAERAQWEAAREAATATARRAHEDALVRQAAEHAQVLSALTGAAHDEAGAWAVKLAGAAAELEGARTAHAEETARLRAALTEAESSRQAVEARLAEAIAEMERAAAESQGNEARLLREQASAQAALEDAQRARDMTVRALAMAEAALADSRAREAQLAEASASERSELEAAVRSAALASQAGADEARRQLAEVAEAALAHAARADGLQAKLDAAAEELAAARAASADARAELERAVAQLAAAVREKDEFATAASARASECDALAAAALARAEADAAAAVAELSAALDRASRAEEGAAVKREANEALQVEARHARDRESALEARVDELARDADWARSDASDAKRELEATQVKLRAAMVDGERRAEEAASALAASERALDDCQAELREARGEGQRKEERFAAEADARERALAEARAALAEAETQRGAAEASLRVARTDLEAVGKARAAAQAQIEQSALAWFHEETNACAVAEEQERMRERIAKLEKVKLTERDAAKIKELRVKYDELKARESQRDPPSKDSLYELNKRVKQAHDERDSALAAAKRAAEEADERVRDVEAKCRADVQYYEKDNLQLMLKLEKLGVPVD